MAAFGIVDPACPIEWGHPLNRGLVADWTIVPNAGWRGGLLRNLVRGGRYARDGTLATGLSFRTTPRPGGYGSIYNDDSTSNGVTVTGNPITGRASFAVAGWFRVASVSFTSIAIAQTYDNAVGDGYYLRMDGASSALMTFEKRVSYSSATAIANAAFTTGVWYHLVGSCNAAGSVRLYVNGVLQTTTATNTGTVTNTSNTSLNVAFGGGSTRTSYVDGVRLWIRDLNDAQARQVYEEDRRGSPERYRWIGKRTWFPPEQADVTPSTWCPDLVITPDMLAQRVEMIAY